MTLRDKLRRLDPAGRAQTGGGAPAVATAVARYDDPFALHTYTQAEHAPHGEVRLQAAALEPAAVGRISKTPALAAVAPRDWVFLDTETTGLHGGAGTVAFLVGIGAFTDDGFTVRQYLMRDYPEEPAMLAAVEEAVAGAGAVVTYNGKSFDVPLMRDRFAMQRRRWPLDQVPHVDLLHMVRRLWRERLAECSLASVERRLLGFERTNDLPGALVPEQYFRALREQNPDLLDDILDHNRNDILSLAALAVVASEVGSDPFAASAVEVEDLVHVGRTFEAAADATGRERAAACYARAAASPVSDTAHDAAWRLGLLAKRREAWDEAEDMWQGLLRAEWPRAVAALEELAKVCEHRRKDFAAAEQWCRRALDRLGAARRLNAADRPRIRQWEQRFTHRLTRLRKRLARTR